MIGEVGNGRSARLPRAKPKRVPSTLREFEGLASSNSPCSLSAGLSPAFLNLAPGRNGQPGLVRLAPTNTATSCGVREVA
ncbi:MAG TPA: hypothetical protein VGR97_04515, partial [Candidatus Acidoferrales bacterium]|nr:hypothetical protein [Candidatus Acidoferrales bacterium]